MEPSHSPPELATASANGLAHTCSTTSSAIDEPGSSCSAKSSTSSSPMRLWTSSTSVSYAPEMSSSSSLISNDATVPSVSFATKRRSTTRMVPASTSSARAGAISPLNPLSGNPTTNISMGPRLIVTPSRLGCGRDTSGPRSLTPRTGPELAPRDPLLGKLGAIEHGGVRKVEAILNLQRVLEDVGGVEHHRLATLERPFAVAPLVTIPVLHRHHHPQLAHFVLGPAVHDAGRVVVVDEVDDVVA